MPTASEALWADCLFRKISKLPCLAALHQMLPPCDDQTGAMRRGKRSERVILGFAGTVEV